MAKTANTILTELGLSEDSTLEELYAKLDEYTVIKESEKANVKSVSVHVLPTVVKNDEENLKRKMYGIVTDDNKGAVSLINKRTVLISTILKNFKNDGLTNLGLLTKDPSLSDHNVLIKEKYITNTGYYTFTYNGIQHIMFVDVVDSTETRQTIYSNTTNVFERIVRIYDGVNWTVLKDGIPTISKVQSMIDKKISTQKEKPNDLKVGEYIFLIKEEK